jgi:hypothetical protein
VAGGGVGGRRRSTVDGGTVTGGTVGATVGGGWVGGGWVGGVWVGGGTVLGGFVVGAAPLPTVVGAWGLRVVGGVGRVTGRFGGISVPLTLSPESLVNEVLRH